jgi:hypothetical protein
VSDVDRPYAPSPVTGPPPAANSLTVGEFGLYLFGWLSLLAGLYFLFVSPNTRPADTDYGIARDIPQFINLHRMYIGQTFTIVGAIFLAAACRPHR